MGDLSELLTLNTLLRSVSGNFQLIGLSRPVVTCVTGTFFGLATSAFLIMTTPVFGHSHVLKQIVKHITGVVSNYGCWEFHSQLLSKYV